MAKNPDSGFSYKIEAELGVISENAQGWQTKLNLVSWNGRPAKYDVRSWSPDGEKMGKGVSLTEEEMNTLIELFRERDEPDEL